MENQIDDSPRVLVIDDDPIIRELMQATLALNGVLVDTTDNARSAISNVLNMEYDVVFTDYRMPIMNGIEFWETVKKKDPSVAKRIIFVTADATNDVIQKFLRHNHIRYLDKPFTRNSLIQALNEVLQSSKSEQTVK